MCCGHRRGGISNTLGRGFTPCTRQGRGFAPSLDPPQGSTTGSHIKMSDKQQSSDKPKKKKRSDSENRERYVLNTFRSSKEERDEMRANAAAVGLSFGSFIRSLALTHPRTRAVR